MLNALIIFGMQLIIVPLTTLRTTFMVKGRRKEATLVGLVEAFIYVTALGVVFSDLTNHLNMIAYALGYAGGLMLGGIVEQKLAIGYRTINVSLLERNDSLVTTLREEGYGVTLFEGEGRDNSKRIRIEIVAKRSREKDLMKVIGQEAPKAFVVAYEPTSFKGGYMIKNLRK